MSATGQPDWPRRAALTVSSVRLERFAYAPHATMGRLWVGDEQFWTIERPWLGNKPFESCIPEGVYAVRKYSSERFPDVWELQDVPERDYILIHAGNYATDVQGCIAVGTGFARGSWMVTNSRDAIGRLHDLLPTEFDISISFTIPEYP